MVVAAARSESNSLSWTTRRSNSAGVCRPVTLSQLVGSLSDGNFDGMFVVRVKHARNSVSSRRVGITIPLADSLSPIR